MLYIDPATNLVEALAEKLHLVDDLLLFKPSLKVLPPVYASIKDVITNYELGKIGIERFGQEMERNAVLNSAVSAGSINEFFDLYPFKSQIVALVSAGPSLDKSIEDLRDLRPYIKILP